MINFQAPKPSDKPWVDRMLVHATGRGSEFNFTNMYIWNHTFSQRLACVGGFLVVRAIEVMGSGYLWPVGQGDRGAVITALEADAAERGEPFRLICLGRSHVEELEALFPGAFEFATNRNGFDYLYEIDRLADLRGKKLHAKRNHCNRFEAEFPDWKYEDLTPASLEECLVVDREWYLRTKLKEGHTKATMPIYEDKALHLATRDFNALGLEGGLLRVYGEVVAFTIGDRLTEDTYDVHFEKAYPELPGAYAMINREFARRMRELHPELRYFNREDDMGLEGLRKAKESYYPDLMAEKHTAVRVPR